MPPYRIDNINGINVNAETLYTATRDGEYIPISNVRSISVGDVIWETVDGRSNITTSSAWSRFEIINCKDCKHYNQDGYRNGCGWCNLDSKERTSDWYCAEAERK